MSYGSAARSWQAGLAALLLVGCATRPTTPSTHTWPQPCDDCVPGLRNFGKVNDGLWRAAQPDTNDADVFRRLEQAGVKTVINLRHDHDDFPALAASDIAYVHIPMRAWRPNDEDMVLFLASVRRALADPQRSPVLVHCAEGKDRTGYAIAAYRIVEQGWDADSAIQEMFDFHYNSLWFLDVEYLRRLAARRDEIAARVAKAR
jgi:protein tyrosine phosphatase (PTP) superfamily phosphohydrolase (DUF442 family)